MINTVQSIKDKLKKVSKEKCVDFNIILRFYMYDRFVERLSKSVYKDNFVLKGGFYISNLFGIDNRSTMDIDTAIRKTNFSKDNLLKMIKEIISIDTGDNVKFSVIKVESIMDEDEYGGLRFIIEFKLENIKDVFHIDMATGDPIYPRPMNYTYHSLINDDVYRVWSYTIETIIAEKIETILSKLELSSRMKDYYDIYLIYKLKHKTIDKEKLRIAVEKTFKKREFKADIKNSLKILKESSILNQKWNSYSRKNNYAKNIEFKDTLKCLEQFINML